MSGFLTTGVPDSAYTFADQKRMAAATNYFAWQRRLVGEFIGNRVLEVGCGMGNFTRLLLDRELVVGVDIDANVIRAHRQQFRSHSWVKSIHTDVLAASAADLSGFQLDSAVFLNVLEHIEDDVEALRCLRRVLPQGATIVVLVPAFMGLYGPIDQLLGHYRRYTRRSLGETAKSAGLLCEHTRYVNAAGFAGWWLNAKVTKRTEQSEGQIRTFDRWVVPVQSRVERVLHPPIGQSVLAVLRQP
jgi:ubiquinone/menaquinone biosynthesis C-methylase UbiE